jgi:hypothetical protein
VYCSDRHGDTAISKTVVTKRKLNNLGSVLRAPRAGGEGTKNKKIIGSGNGFWIEKVLQLRFCNLLFFPPLALKRLQDKFGMCVSQRHDFHLH